MEYLQTSSFPAFLWGRQMMEWKSNVSSEAKERESSLSPDGYWLFGFEQMTSTPQASPSSALKVGSEACLS